MYELLLPPLLLPSAAALIAMWGHGRRWTSYLTVLSAVTVLGTGVLLVWRVSVAGPAGAPGGLLRADMLSAWMLTTVGAVSLVALWSGLPTTRGPSTPDGRYTALLCLFLAAMSLGVLSDNLGVLWVAIEATTITTAFLVGHHRTQKALEAAWKYVVLGSVGVAIAFLGIVLLYAASAAAGDPSLSWTHLTGSSAALDPSLTRIAVGLAALGFATKAGLAPMHSWLPDAHSQAPAPVSGLMSGVLLSVALYAILRVQRVSDMVLGPDFMRGMLVTLGLLSLAVAAVMILAQRDYKRMLAYSSIEHMGIMALGAATGGVLAVAAVLLHMLGHGLVKASMFVVAGRILSVENTSRTSDVSGLLARHPALGRQWLTGATALLGLPPFVLFFTEVVIIVAGWREGLGWAMSLALAMLLIVFAGLSRHTANMTLGVTDGGSPAAQGSPATTGWRTTPLTLGLAGAVAAAFVAVPFARVLADAASVVTGA